MKKVYCLQYRLIWTDGQSLWSNLFRTTNLEYIKTEYLPTVKLELSRKYKDDFGEFEMVIEKIEYRVLEEKVVFQDEQTGG